MGPYYQAFPEGGSLTIHDDDPARTREQIAQWSSKDARAWERVERVAGRARRRARPAADDRAARPSGPTRPRDVAAPGEAGLAQPRRRRAHGRRRDPADDDEHRRPARRLVRVAEVKGAMAVNGVIGTWAGPYEPGTAYVMAHHSIGDVGDGQLGSWGYPEGGMGAVSAAIRRSAESFGAEVRTDAPVASLLVHGRPGRGRRPRVGRGAAGAGRGHQPAPQARLPRARRRRAPARRLRARHRALAVAQRRREDQPRHRPAADVHRRPERRARPSTTPARWRWRRRWSTSSAPSSTPARGGRRRRRSPTG